MNELLYDKMRMVSTNEWLAGLLRDTDKFEWCAALPSLPDEQFQRRFVGRAYSEAMQQAFDAVEEFRQGLARLGCQFDEDAVALDFGCGWGRISQTMYRYFRPYNIISADIQSDAVDFCFKSGLATKIIQVYDNNLHQILNESVDCIFAYSVFSHLSENAANIWIKEFVRILKPGGAIAVTTRAPSIIRHALNLLKLPKQEIPLHGRGLIEAFFDADKALEEYNDGVFVYRDYPHPTKSGVDYGEAIIPEHYVANVWLPIFGGGYSFLPPVRTLDQAIIFLRKL
ncbi:2-polyprenyl-3-methyl-5-hydroxy-6-metoxy-1,4-benzoquinol methylase [Desulfomicrobium macestii]|uniref:2-polyprenyl-3-methyl-5-hydroxy-6-metoxy-1, 4-benzoquinol methylase n=1 Tax=Desulfomicrobium macestii TaxID=90731 RepID=A0ABR9H1K5_9BACT|nr:class I SAM-dependent methyltransferase [Desulfomicrobium macestii]MBE1424582.1 2-polyprenyl-3-methyl-5-hydroxy-6-metoxy-1,4-benzoquinol methylase [Desulfomicrobium macestii]